MFDKKVNPHRDILNRLHGGDHELTSAIITLLRAFAKLASA